MKKQHNIYFEVKGSKTTVFFRPTFIMPCPTCGDIALFGVLRAKLSGDRAVYKLLCMECNYQLDYIENKENVDKFIFKNKSRYKKDPKVTVVFGKVLTENDLMRAHVNIDQFFDLMREEGVAYNFV